MALPTFTSMYFYTKPSTVWYGGQLYCQQNRIQKQITRKILRQFLRTMRNRICWGFLRITIVTRFPEIESTDANGTITTSWKLFQTHHPPDETFFSARFCFSSCSHYRQYHIIIQWCHDRVLKQDGLDCMDKVILQFTDKQSVPALLECTVPAHTTLAQQIQ